MNRINQEVDERPPIWVGHVSLDVASYRDSLKFFRFLGMRSVAKLPGLAVLELRGGTHLVLSRNKKAEPGTAAFDLMVDDLKAQHRALKSAGYAPGPIRKGRIHSAFEVVEPSGHTIRFNDSHVAGVV